MVELGVANVIAHQDQHAEDVLGERQPGVASYPTQAEAGTEALAEGLDDGGQQDDEAVKNEEVQDPRIAVAEHSGVGADIFDDALDPLRDVVQAVFIRPQPQDAIQLPRPVDEVESRGCQQKEDGHRFYERHCANRTLRSCASWP